MAARLRTLLLFVLPQVFLASAFAAPPAHADSSHVRIVRVSYVQGDVRFAREVKGDPLTDSNNQWETAVLNLPIRQGYVLATDDGRAEVEFEDGAKAFLAEKTVLEFYDLSSEDGGLTTRLVLRQGSAEFNVHPANGDYFSVTGGDFSVQADARVTFRMNNFDDGSNVSVLRGRLTALVNGKETPLKKEQTLAMTAGGSMNVEHSADRDDFDQWVAGRIETSTVATQAAQQYYNSGGYVSGFNDLYTYGAWFPVAGYGYCWRPFGVSAAWAPFDFGSWYFDPVFGWSFLGPQVWGWLPYHYGGWLFQPGVGWVWNPNYLGGGPGVGRWRPVTGVWMRASGTTAIVPAHPLDTRGKTPINLAQGTFTVTQRGVGDRLAAPASDKWKVESRPAKDLLQNQLAQAAAPVRVSRTMVANAGAIAESGIVYDRAQGRFVNNEAAIRTNAEANATGAMAPANAAREAQGNIAGSARGGVPTTGVPIRGDRMNGREGQNAANVPAASERAAMPRPPVAPPSVPRSIVTERVFNGGASANAGGGRGGSPSAGGGASGSASRGSAPSGASSSGSSSGSGAGRSSGGSSGGGGGGGGRPH